MTKYFIVLYFSVVLAVFGSEGITIESEADLLKAEALAEAHNQEAAVRVGEFYLFGPIHYQDHEKALYFLKKAMKFGNLEAIELIAGMYLNGRGVDQDEVMATRLYEIAASQGHGPSEFNLGIIYKRGGGALKAHPQKAYYWLYRAVLNESLDELRYDAALYRNQVGELLSQGERMAILEKIYKEKEQSSF